MAEYNAAAQKKELGEGQNEGAKSGQQTAVGG
jgi:hypothetical protein